MSEPAKILCFINDDHDGQLHVVAMTLSGDVLRTEICKTVVTAKSLINDNVAKEVYALRFPDGYRPVWIDNPREHGEALEASRLHLERESPEATPQPPTPTPTPGELRLIFESQHICRLCSHQAVCTVAQAIDRHAENGEFVVLGGCTMLDQIETDNETSP